MRDTVRVKKLILMGAGQDKISPEMHELYTSIFNTENGKLILCDLENRFNVHSPIMESGEAADRAEGRRQVILFILDMLVPLVEDKKEGVPNV